MSATTHLTITRHFAAPCAEVYRAFVDPERIVAWFGPVGWSVPRHTVDIDARVGGHQRFAMVNDADPAQRAPVDATFTEVVEDQLLAGTEDWRIEPDAPMRTTMRLEFHDEGGRTRLELRQGPYPAEMEPMARQGWQSSFTKLDALLTTTRDYL